MHVLVVDDDPAVLEFLEEAIAAGGHEVDTAANFAEARQFLAERPDALVVDVRLGEFNGLQLAIFARQSNESIRIIVMSGVDDPVIRREAAACGAAFVTKPIQRDALLRALTEESPRQTSDGSL